MDEGGNWTSRSTCRIRRVLGGLHPATGDPVASRHDPARTAARPVLQGRTAIPAWCGALATIRARSSRASGRRPSSSAATRGVRADRQQPVARSAGPDRRADHRRAKHLPPNKFPMIPPQVDPDPGPPVVQLPPVPPGPGPAPHAPFPLPVPPNEPGARHRRGPISHRRTRSCRRTAERRRPRGQYFPGGGTRAARRTAATARGGAGPSGRWSGRRDLRPERKFVDPAGGMASTRPVLTNWRPRRTG